MPPSIPQFPCPNPPPTCHLSTCLPASFPFLLPPRSLSPPVMEANLSPADVLMSNGCGSINRQRPQQTGSLKGCRENSWGGLSGKAGRLSITVPMEKAARSPALHGQIRPPDGAAQQLDPTHDNGWDRADAVRDRQVCPASRPLCFSDSFC